MRVLVVEDDAAIARALVEGLPHYGFEVRAVSTGAAALELHPEHDVVLLDLGLPDLDGIDVCRRIRAVSTVPLLIITARSDEVDRVVGLELGADDYLSKPFGMRELVARVRAVLRRTTPGGADAAGGGEVAAAGAVGSRPDREQGSTTSAPLTCGLVDVDLDARRVHVDGVEARLTPKEFDLVAVLIDRPGAVHTREDLISEVWDPHWFGSTRTLDVHVGALRRKLGPSVEIQTVRGVGFRLESTVGREPEVAAGPGA